MTKQSQTPAKILGILGSGQLGRMSAMAADKLGIKTHIYAPEKGPATLVSADNTVGNYDDKDKLKAFAESVDVISYEFENIPVETVRYLQNIKPVYPDDKLLEVSQNRLVEKQFLNDIHISTARWAPARNPQEISDALQALDLSEAIIKTTRFGYDGKGQIFHKANADFSNTWSTLKTDEVIVEEPINFLLEISVVIARDQFGDSRVYPPVQNEHSDHILAKTTYPAPISDKTATEAQDMAMRLADATGLIGVLALELFVTQDGGLLANEIAPRTHNSGHWTIDACEVSQFENHVRCVCGLPVGDPAPHSHAIMINLIGDDVDKAQHYAQQKNAHVHLYGKTEVRPGRKMGHVTILKNTKI